MLKRLVNLAAAAALSSAAPAFAQIAEIDPNRADQYQAGTYDGDAATPETWEEPAPVSEWAPLEPQADETIATETAARPSASSSPRTTEMPRDDVFAAAEGVFGRGAEGLADLIEDILRDQGEPTAYIAGQEAGGAFVFGVRYGSGVMRHQVEGERTVYWTGPSLGFDFGADANKVFVLVYNLHDSQELFRRYPGAEGNAYVVGGFTAQYLRRGNVVLIPIRMGVGLRLGVNAGYMRFSERNRWLPF